MSLRNFRTFTIILVLELASFESRVEAFTIQRTTNSNASDLAAAESINLEVRNDLNKHVKLLEATNVSPPLTVPIQTTAKTEEIQKNATTSTTPANNKLFSSEKPVFTSEITMSEEETDSTVASTKTTPVSSNISSFITSKTKPMTTKEKMPKTTPSTTTENDAYMENNSTLIPLENVTSVKYNKNGVNSTIPVNIKNSINNTNKINTTLTMNVTNLVNYTNEVNPTEPMKVTEQINTTEEVKSVISEVEATSQVLKETSLASVNNTVTNTTWKNNNTETKVVDLMTEESNATSYSTETVDLSTNNDAYNGNQVTSATNENTTMNVKLPAEAKLADKYLNNVEDLTRSENGDTIIPSWKKYTSIERKRPKTINVAITSTEDFLQSGTAQTQTSISLEKAFNIISDIPSLEQLKNDLLAANKISTTTEAINYTNLVIFQGINGKPLTNDSSPINNKKTPTLEISNQEYNIVSSKRAGFLDYSSRPGIENGINATDESYVDISTIPVISNGAVITGGADFPDFPQRPSTGDGKKPTDESIVDVSTKQSNGAVITGGADFSDFLQRSGDGDGQNPTEVDFSNFSQTAVVGNELSSTGAGFFNFSSNPVTKNDKISVEKTGSINEVPFSYTSSPNPKTTLQALQTQYSMTSQSQLVDDAIKEELLEEEILSDSVENAKRQKGDRSRTITEPTKSKEKTTTEIIKVDTSSEDKLRVKPINYSKLRNGSLYTVSPNYKPLKKIDVQPPKPFVRDPDDNSWRNESLSSLGIVFKANNSPKTFTQVLKNKTETELNTLLGRYNKDDEPELRTRLEKIAEQRKNNKKKINSLGETVYTDYEDPVSGENWNASKASTFPLDFKNFSIFDVLDKLTTTPAYTFADLTTTMKATKTIDDYEDEDEPDYSLPQIDLKKYITPTLAAPSPFSPALTARPLISPPSLTTIRTNPPNRHPTVEYFPPREKQHKVVVNDYDTGFRNKVNEFTYSSPKVSTILPEKPAVTFDFQKIKLEQQRRPDDIPSRPKQMDKNVYLTGSEQNNNAYGNHHDAAGYNQASYVIKHLRDLIDDVVQSGETLPTITEEPLQGVTANTMTQAKPPNPSSDYYDYEAQFRRDVLSRFAENFNQNSERFKADFPLLYNTSVLHSQPGVNGGGAESSAFMKRLYDDIRAFQQTNDVPKRYDPNCDRTVELSPAYELHYYVPEQEEKEEIDPKSVRPPHYRVRL